MRRSRPGHIRTTHIGSLPRSPALLDVLRARNAGGDVTPDVFEPAVAAATADVLERQLAAGLTTVNDGEQSKFAYLSYHLDRLTGFEVVHTRTVEESAALPQGSPGERADFPGFFERWKWSTQTRFATSPARDRSPTATSPPSTATSSACSGPPTTVASNPGRAPAGTGSCS